MNLPDWIPWCFAALSLLGAYVNAKGNLFASSWIWLCSNMFWLYLDGTRELWAQCALYIAFIITNIVGIRTSLRINLKEDHAVVD